MEAIEVTDKISLEQLKHSIVTGGDPVFPRRQNLRHIPSLFKGVHSKKLGKNKIKYKVRVKECFLNAYLNNFLQGAK